jgi:ABC-type sugar transport system ATPase subunit
MELRHQKTIVLIKQDIALFFVLSIVKNLFLDKDTINYLKYVCFIIVKMYCVQQELITFCSKHRSFSIA